MGGTDQNLTIHASGSGAELELGDPGGLIRPVPGTKLENVVLHLCYTSIGGCHAGKEPEDQRGG